MGLASDRREKTTKKFPIFVKRKKVCVCVRVFVSVCVCVCVCVREMMPVAYREPFCYFSFRRKKKTFENFHFPLDKVRKCQP